MKKFPKPWFRPSRNTWYVTLDGSQINLGSDKEAAFVRYRELLAKPRKAPDTSDSLACIIDAFLEWTQKHRSPDTYEWYRYRLQRFIDKYAELRAVDVRPFHVQQWVDSYQLSQTSCRNYIRSVKRCLKWATAQGYLDANPIQHLEVPNGESKEVLITLEEYQRLLTFVPAGPFRDLIEVTWETGCRPQESLRVEARHFEASHQRWVFPCAESKGRRAPRVVYLSDAAFQITRRLVAAHPSGKIFRNSKGCPWTKDAVNCAFDRVRVRMGKAVMRHRRETPNEDAIKKLVTTLSPTRRVKGKIVEKTEAELRCEARQKLVSRLAAQLVPRYSLYALRHSWATRALQSGTDSLTVAILMGHSDPSTLARVYQHLSHNPVHLLNQAKKAAG